MIGQSEGVEKRSKKEKSKNKDKGEKRCIEDNEIERQEKKKKKKKNKKDASLNEAEAVDINQSTEEVKEDDDSEEVVEKALSNRKLKKVKTNVIESNKEDAKEDNNRKEEDGEEEEEVEGGKKKEPSKRKLKKEKAELRALQAKEASKQEHSQKALNYVSKWKHAKSQWKFEKLKQIWLIDNFLNDKYVPDDNFSDVLEYLEGCKGAARKQVIDKSMAVVKKIEDNLEEDEEIVETTEYKRARQLLQALPTET